MKRMAPAAESITSRGGTPSSLRRCWAYWSSSSGIEQTYEQKGGAKLTRKRTCSEVFVLHQRRNGDFALVDSPFFDTLGRVTRVDLVADVILAAILVFAAMAFTVWMGFEAYWMRPRKRVWRALVLLPILGPMLFFLGVYLPRWRRGGAQA